MKIKTIDIQAKEWFDKTYGNSYFSANVTLNYGMKTEKSIYLPFQYGYGSHYIDMAFKALQKQKIIKTTESNEAFWRFCERNKIILRTSKKENCLKRDL